jgi:hypothetical protein
VILDVFIEVGQGLLLNRRSLRLDLGHLLVLEPDDLVAGFRELDEMVEFDL